jgi:hypothetical protein
LANLDTEVRMAAFDWLSKKSAECEDVIPRPVLSQGLHNKRLFIPRKSDFRPDPALLSRRWEKFRSAVA